VDMEKEYLGFLDSAGGQNYKNSTRTLHAPKTKNKMITNDEKFKKNFTAILGVNCESFVMNTPNSRSFQMGLFLANARKTISDNPQSIEALDKVLNNVNLTDKHVKTTLKQIRPSRRETIETINNQMYNEELSYDKIAKNCKNYFRRLDVNYNTDKVDERKMINFLKNCEIFQVCEIFKKEKVLNIVLDNYSVHHTVYYKAVAEMLNINLIFLPTYSPDLNPIEDVWRIIKKFVSNKFIKNGKDIVDLYISKFYEEVTNSSLYEEWLKEFMNICMKS